MKSCLNLIRWFLGILNSLSLVFFLLIVIFLSAVSITIINRDNIKGWLKSSTLYDNIKKIAIETMINTPVESTGNPETTEEQDQTSQSSFFQGMGERLNDPNDEFSKLIDKIVTPQFLENSVNTIINASYDWLEGKTDNLTFSINIVENKDDLKELVSVTFKEKAKTLPPCATNFRVTPEFNPLETNCWPIGMDYMEVNNFVEKNSDREEFKTLATYLRISSDSLVIPAETSKNIHLIFNIIRFIPVVSVLIILILVGLIMLFVPTKIKAFIIVGIAVLIPCIIWITIALSGVLSAEFIFSRLPVSMNSSQFNIILPYAKLLVGSVLNSFWTATYIIISILLLIVVVIFVVLFVKKRKNSQVAIAASKA